MTSDSVTPTGVIVLLLKSVPLILNTYGPSDCFVISALIDPSSPWHNISVKIDACISRVSGSSIVNDLDIEQSLASVIVTLYVPGDKSLKSSVDAEYELSPDLDQE